jgi:NADH:ubiquinone oxidoreductase subunit 3 (subunit A)
MLWIGIFIGIFLGANVGIFVITMCIAANKGDQLKKAVYDK